MRKTQVLLSSVVTLPRLARVFKIADKLGFHGLELMPYRWTDPIIVRGLSAIWKIPVMGIHLPFWWRTKSLGQVVKSEYLLREKLFACAWQLLFGAGHQQCPAVQLLGQFPDAYCIIHPDTYRQAWGEHGVFHGHRVFVENERPKKGEGEMVYDPFRIKKLILPCLGPQAGRLMFDPGHAMIAQAQGLLEKRSVAEWYELLQPDGLHLSFSGGGRLHDLPTEAEWQGLVTVIKRYPPEFIVVETAPGPGAYQRVRAARQMITRGLGF